MKKIDFTVAIILDATVSRFFIEYSDYSYSHLTPPVLNMAFQMITRAIVARRDF
jgi:hypothetical protein